MTYELITRWDARGEIDQRLMTKFNDLVTETSRWVLHTREKSIRKALIKLGWTPPRKGKKAKK